MTIGKLPIGDDRTPVTIQEIVHRLKVKEAMSKNVITAPETASLVEIQKLMREKSITGIPIVTENRLVGMISIGDLIAAMGVQYASGAAVDFMHRNLVVLEEDMPLSFAISYFNKYSYHRFPVVNKDSQLTGIITGRDVMAVLLRELEKEVRELEKRVKVEALNAPGQERQVFIICQFDFENAGKASFAIKKALQAKGISAQLIRRVAVAAYELEINVAIHSFGGKLLFIMDDNEVSVIAQDGGPGIADTASVLQEGFSTANDWIRSLGFGAGMGLPNAKRVSDKFSINSRLGKGTKVVATFRLKESATQTKNDTV